jgi:hypothetical protein
MNGAGFFKDGEGDRGASQAHDALDSLGEVDEETRVGPIPLTIKRARVSTPVDFHFPVVASVDVDLKTPAPLPFPITIAAPVRSSSHSPSTGSATTTTASNATNSWGALAMQPRPPSPSRPYIRPTPTFSFTDGPEHGMWSPPQPQRRRSSGPGLFAIGVLMAVAGVGGYMTVKYHAWQEIEPLVARAKELGRSLRTLAPSASPEAPAAAPTAVAPTPAPAPPVLRPTVVPIEPASPPAAKPIAAKPITAKSTAAKTIVTNRVAEPKRRAPERRHRRQLQPLSDEAAAEEALLSGPSRGR